MENISYGKSVSLASSDLEKMFRARKEVFVDRMGWPIGHEDGLERDQFDDEKCIYILITDKYRNHHASARLLSTDRPHILGTIFPELCDDDVPTGPDIYELTRFCVSPHASTRERLHLRNMLFSALVEYALLNNISSYTGVTHMSFLSQVLSIGWRCDVLGLPRESDGSMIAAVQAHVAPDTINLMRQQGTYVSSPMQAIGREFAL